MKMAMEQWHLPSAECRGQCRGQVQRTVRQHPKCTGEWISSALEGQGVLEPFLPEAQDSLGKWKARLRSGVRGYSEL